MRQLVLISAVCALCLLAAGIAAPGADVGFPVVGNTVALEQADAAIGRGGGQGAGGGDARQAGQKWATLLQGWFAPLIFIGTAIVIAIAAVQRNAGLVVVTIVVALVIGAFTLAPDQVEGWFEDIYRFVL